MSLQLFIITPQQLRKKARVHVEDGTVLIGGIDELGVLPENCVFLQIPRTTTRKASSFTGCGCDEYMIVEGPVMVTKHPVMHPGEYMFFALLDTCHFLSCILTYKFLFFYSSLVRRYAHANGRKCTRVA